MGLEAALVDRLYQKANAERWGLSRGVFAHALGISAARSFAGRTPSSWEIERYLWSLHLADVALACGCAAGIEAAWEHFVRELRPSLYRAADALEPGGGARDLADSMYGDLYGLSEKEGERQSLFRYFHGRSSLATWLRAVLVQRHVDRQRAGRRIEPLPDEESAAAPAVSPGPPDPDRSHYLTLTRRALVKAIAGLVARDRLRLGCYYAQELTLAETGRLLHEHEATVSRHLARTRRTIRERVERGLREEDGLNDAQISRCFELVTQDAGSLDLSKVFVAGGKEPEPDRSI
jgi:RNA polymerase sigma-70 factor (ECF subfamily)